MSGVIGCEHFTLIHQIEHYRGVVILTSRRKLEQLDLGRMPQLRLIVIKSNATVYSDSSIHYRHIVELDLPPVELREQIWRKLLPHKAPIDADINFTALAQR